MVKDKDAPPPFRINEPSHVSSICMVETKTGEWLDADRVTPSGKKIANLRLIQEAEEHARRCAEQRNLWMSRYDAEARKAMYWLYAFVCSSGIATILAVRIGLRIFQ